MVCQGRTCGCSRAARADPCSVWCGCFFFSFFSLLLYQYRPAVNLSDSFQKKNAAYLQDPPPIINSFLSQPHGARAGTSSINGAALSICDTAQVPPFQTPPTSRQSWPKHQRLIADAPATSNRHHLPRLPSLYVQPANGSSVQCSVLTRTAAPAGLHMLMVGKAIFTAR